MISPNNNREMVQRIIKLIGSTNRALIFKKPLYIKSINGQMKKKTRHIKQTPPLITFEYVGCLCSVKISMIPCMEIQNEESCLSITNVCSIVLCDSILFYSI